MSRVSRNVPACVLLPLFLGLISQVTFARQTCPPPLPNDETDPPLTSALNYPLQSDRYAVMYNFPSTGVSKTANVYISYYGWTFASPNLSDSNYTPPEVKGTSMSFVSISVPNSNSPTPIVLQVQKLWGDTFSQASNVSVRPTVKGIIPTLMTGKDAGKVQIATTVPANFRGEQFVLWWGGTATESGHVYGLAVFLNPTYPEPQLGTNVLKLTDKSSLTELQDPAKLASYDTVDFEPSGATPPAGIDINVWRVPDNIRTIYFGEDAWVKGKLLLEESGNGGCAADGSGCQRKIYGPGVLDGSEFKYRERDCNTDARHSAIAFAALPAGSPQVRDQYLIDGIVITDTSRYATDLLDNTTVNNVKTIGWNGNNDGLEIGTSTIVSNVFVRSGDDSIKMWGAYSSVTNATVWQNYNGGVVNLGWGNESPGENSLIDGLYVVSEDWFQPVPPTWAADKEKDSIQHLNNAVIDSMTVPGTQFGLLQPSLYKNIYIEDNPNVLFNLKIAPTRNIIQDLPTTSLIDLGAPSLLNLNIAGVHTLASKTENHIGFMVLPGGFQFPPPVDYPPPPGSPACPSCPVQVFPNDYVFTGNINIGLYDVEIIPEIRGVPTILNGSNAGVLGVGNLYTNPPEAMVSAPNSHVNVTFGSSLPSPGTQQWYSAWTAPQDYRIEKTVLMARKGGGVVAVPVPIDNTSYRMIVRPTTNGTSVRVKIENTMGQYPVTFSAIYIGPVAIPFPAPKLFVPSARLASNTQLTFNGSKKLTLAPGAGAYSDPLPYFAVDTLGYYAISLDVETGSDISNHALGLTTNYMAAGGSASDTTGMGFTVVPPNPDPTKGNTYPVYWVSALDVLSSGKSTVVGLGDSITDGRCSSIPDDKSRDEMPDLYQRWTDLLADRLSGSKTIANEGIFGNQIAAYLRNGHDIAGVGKPALLRLPNDVLNREGVSHIILFEGTNDIFAGATAAELEQYDQRIIDDAHALGIKVIGATIIPRGGQDKWTQTMEGHRTNLNNWIKAPGHFDHYIDFDFALRGAVNPNNHNIPEIPATLSCYDHVHPNAAGYSQMYSEINLSVFD